jgi:hypothetical protein
MYDKNFQEISSGKMELFSSFFKALKFFIREIVLEGSKELKNIELGDYTVLITTIPDIKVDLVIIGDKEDHKLIVKIIPNIIKILLKNAHIFIDWKENISDLAILDQPISELILSQKKLIGDKSLIEHPEVILKSMWAHKKELKEQELKDLSQKRDLLIQQFKNSTILPKKLNLAEQLLGISEKLKDDKNFMENQEHIKFLKDEIKESKIKINYYLEKIKNTINQSINTLGNKPLHEGDYKDVYLNLYSFSNKLKIMIDGNEWEKYKDLANIMINKDEFPQEKLSEAISIILKMKDNVEDFLN